MKYYFSLINILVMQIRALSFDCVEWKNAKVEGIVLETRLNMRKGFN